jgi:hypothetical protein
MKYLHIFVSFIFVLIIAMYFNSGKENFNSNDYDPDKIKDKIAISFKTDNNVTQKKNRVYNVDINMKKNKEMAEIVKKITKSFFNKIDFKNNKIMFGDISYEIDENNINKIKNKVLDNIITEIKKLKNEKITYDNGKLCYNNNCISNKDLEKIKGNVNGKGKPVMPVIHLKRFLENIYVNNGKVCFGNSCIYGVKKTIKNIAEDSDNLTKSMSPDNPNPTISPDNSNSTNSPDNSNDKSVNRRLKLLFETKKLNRAKKVCKRNTKCIGISRIDNKYYVFERY